MAEETTIYHVDKKYRVAFKQADTKGVIGFTVEANGDDIAIVKAEATDLLNFAKAHAPAADNG